MRRLTCMIIDDEPLAVKLIQSFVEKTPTLELTGAYTDSIEALARLKENPVDLLFLDIQMPDMDGLELSKMIAEPTRVIFTTAFREYALEGFEVNALDFLLKPIRFSKFSQAVEKAIRWFELTQHQSPNTQHPSPNTSLPLGGFRGAPLPNTHLFLKVDGELRRVELDSIQYISGMKDYMLFFLEGQPRPLTVHITMKTVEDMLPSDRFMRVNRSFIVALDKIRSIDKNMCLYIGNEIIRVTDSYRDIFNNYLRNLQG